MKIPATTSKIMLSMDNEFLGSVYIVDLITTVLPRNRELSCDENNTIAYLIFFQSLIEA